MSGRITPPPPTQALGSTPFVPPPLDFSLIVTETIYFHRTHSPNHVVYVYEEAPGELRQIDFTAWIRAIHRAGRYAREVFQLPELQVGGEKPVVSILASSELRIIRAECVAFPVSPKNSATSVAHLINKTGSRHVFVTQYLKPLVDAATAILKKQGQGCLSFN